MSFLRFDGDRICYEADFHAPAPATAPSASPAPAPIRGRPGAATRSGGARGWRRRRRARASAVAGGAEAAGEAPAVGRAHDHVLVVAAVPPAGVVRGPRVRGQELAVHPHLPAADTTMFVTWWADGWLASRKYSRMASNPCNGSGARTPV